MGPAQFFLDVLGFRRAPGVFRVRIYGCLGLSVFRALGCVRV